MVVVWVISGVMAALAALLFIPMRGRRYERPVMKRYVDERDTMFSRNEIKPGEERFEEYYRMRPGNREPDNRFRAKPGLLATQATQYNRYAFASADASFEAVEAFFGMRAESGEKRAVSREQGKENEEEMEKLSFFLKEWSKKMGAHSVGITELKDYHFYTIGGRRERYGKPVVNNHKYAVVFTVEMDRELTATGPDAPIVMESAHQYLNAGMIATQVALTLRNLGYEATTHIDANYDLICPLVAKDAGLGEIGRMGLLMTPELGPRVRISAVSTNAPLIPGTPVHDNSVLDFCTRCEKCAVVCPSASIPKGERQQHEGGIRWQINQESCFNYWCRTGTDCGRCMAACPYSHKDNMLHNFVRWGIRNNFLFRRMAVVLDDVFYGTRPKQARRPEWISE